MNYSSDFYYYVMIEEFERGLDLREKIHDFFIAKRVLDIAIKYTEKLLKERASIISCGSDPENYYFQLCAHCYSSG